MVRKTIVSAIAAIFVCLPSIVWLFAGDFDASVSSNQVRLGETFALNLTLRDISPKEAPSINELRKDFLIHSQQHMTNTSFINGKSSSSITWKLTLTPKAEGTVEIPSIAIETSEGRLYSQPIRLQILKNSSQSNEDAGPSVSVYVSNDAPYKNEPILYTATLTSKWPLYNIQAQKLQVEDAIVELIEEPKLSEKIVDGVKHNVVTFNYLITPLKSDTLTIPPIVIQGATPQQQRRGQGNTFFSDDPFALMQGFDRLKPFALMTDELQLNIQPAVAEVTPWLPAKGLTLEEIWPSDQTLRVGEPFSRSFIVNGIGVKVGMIPRLESQQSQNATFKVYADKPEEEEKIYQGTLFSTRKEQYTLIPQQEGTSILPAITVSWWDSVAKVKRSALIPARTIQILPALEAASSSISQETVTAPNTRATSSEISPSEDSPLAMLYAIIGALSFFLVVSFFWGLTLHYKIKSLTQSPKQKTRPAPAPKPTPKPNSAYAPKPKRETLPDLNPT